ncbi:MAG: TldD/PmbA family protein [Clostridia bacterium]|nr:TldD/PmbA family protein [Clostridia bacterium]
MCALQKGGDFAELFFEDSLSNSVQLISGKIETANTARTYGAGLRVYNGFNSIYAHTCDVSADGLIDLARQVSDAVGKSKVQNIDIALNEPVAAKNDHPALIPTVGFDAKTRSDFLKRADASARKYAPGISQVSSTIMDKVRKIAVCNSDGLYVTDEVSRVRFAVEAIASKDGENQVGFEGPGALSGYEFIDTIDPETLAIEAAKTAITMLEADQCPAGEMPVVIGPGFGGVIFHEACGHSLEATSVALGNSEFCGKLHTQIASERVTAIDDGTMPGGWGSINIDDEGTPASKLVLIDRGILVNYMVDRLNGRRMNTPSTGSARRQSFEYAPTSRMTNTYIAAGEDDEDEMIRTMGDGLFARKMGGGSVNPVTGEFNFSVSEGYLVRDGKIVRPVRGATLTGKGADILMNIDRVGKNLSLASGMCGSISGMIPVRVGQPSIRVSRITVGGRAI